jgi:hypothetical protein
VRRALAINEERFGRRPDDTIVTVIQDGKQSIYWDYRRAQRDEAEGESDGGQSSLRLPGLSWTAPAAGITHGFLYSSGSFTEIDDPSAVHAGAAFGNQAQLRHVEHVESPAGCGGVREVQAGKGWETSEDEAH